MKTFLFNVLGWFLNSIFILILYSYKKPPYSDLKGAGCLTRSGLHCLPSVSQFFNWYSVLLWSTGGTICLAPCLADMRRSKRQHSPEEEWVEDRYSSQRKEEAQTTKRPRPGSPAQEAELQDTCPRKNHHGKTYQR